MDSGTIDAASKISLLERDLRLLITHWEQFFCGEVRVPPKLEKDKLNRRLRLLAERSSSMRSSDRFRLDQLQHRFMSYAMNWERQLREREEGVRRWIPGQRRPAPSGSSSRPPNGEGATNVESKERDLYAQWCAAQADLGQKVTISREAFDKKMDRQKSQIEARTGAPVAFDVRVVDGKVKVTARRAGRAKNGA